MLLLFFVRALSVFGVFVCALYIVIWLCFVLCALCFVLGALGFGLWVMCFFASVSLCVFVYVCGCLWVCGALCQLAIVCLVVKKEVINMNTNSK